MASAALFKGALWMQNVDYPASKDRSLIDTGYTEGVMSGFMVTPNGGLNISISAGNAVITGDEVSNQGKYLIESDGSVSLLLDPVGSTRTEYVYLAVNDAAVAGGRVGDNVTIETSVTPPGNSTLLLATLTLTSGAITITSGMIADSRIWAGRWDTPGALMDVAGTGRTVNGWLPCNGAAVGRTVYPELFAAIGTLYGAGDGSTTFNVPDFRQRVAVPAGLTRNAGQTGGSETHVQTEAEMATHSHSGAGHSHSIPGHTHPMSHTHSIAHGHGSASTSTNTHDHTDISKATEQIFEAASGGVSENVASNLDQLFTTPSSSHSHTVTVPNFSGSSADASTSTTGTNSTVDTGQGTGGGSTAGSSSPMPLMQPFVVIASRLIKT